MASNRLRKKKSSANISNGPKEKRSLLIYYVGVIVFAFIYHIISKQAWFISLASPIFMAYASISSSIINVFGEQSIAEGAGISSSHFSLTIKEGCDAITPMILYSMAILSFPISFRLKWPGLALGLPALFILNITRIVSLYYVGKHFRYEVFDFMHVSFWQVLFLILTVFTWLIWMRWAFVIKSSYK